ncbi:MAG: hypothetical protein AB7D07_10145 [Desulfovibrionaceae bacterium]
MGFLYQRFYVLLFLLWLGGVGLVVFTTLWGDMSAVMSSLGVNGTVTESADEALGVGSSFFQKVSAVLEKDSDSANSEIAELGGVASGNVSQAEDGDDTGSVPAWKRPGFTDQVLRQRKEATQAEAARAEAATQPAEAQGAQLPAENSTRASAAPAVSAGKSGADSQGRRRPQPSSRSEKAPAPGAPAQTAKPDKSPAPQQADANGKTASQPSEAEAGVLTVAQFESAPDHFTVKLAANRPVPRCTYFWLNNPRKLVLDVLGKWRFKGRNVNRFDQGAIEKIVFGEHPGKVRLVLYYRDPSAPVGSDPDISLTDGGVACVVRMGSPSQPGAGKTPPQKAPPGK